MPEFKRNCTDLVGLLADFVERHLPAEVHAELERHLAACPRCVAQLKTYESTVSLLRSIRDEDLPAELRCTLKAWVDRNCDN
jgi:anti-sigma factor RsiW